MQPRGGRRPAKKTKKPPRPRRTPSHPKRGPVQALISSRVNAFIRRRWERDDDDDEDAPAAGVGVAEPGASTSATPAGGVLAGLPEWSKLNELPARLRPATPEQIADALAFEAVLKEFLKRKKVKFKFPTGARPFTELHTDNDGVPFAIDDKVEYRNISFKISVNLIIVKKFFALPANQPFADDPRKVALALVWALDKRQYLPYVQMQRDAERKGKLYINAYDPESGEGEGEGELFRESDENAPLVRNVAFAIPTAVPGRTLGRFFHTGDGKIVTNNKIYKDIVRGVLADMLGGDMSDKSILRYFRHFLTLPTSEEGLEDGRRFQRRVSFFQRLFGR